MEKTSYIKPTTDFITIKSQQILAGSLGDNPLANPYNPTDTPTTNDADGNLSRGGFWDDDEEEY